MVTKSVSPVCLNYVLTWEQYSGNYDSSCNMYKLIQIWLYFSHTLRVSDQSMFGGRSQWFSFVVFRFINTDNKSGINKYPCRIKQLKYMALILQYCYSWSMILRLSHKHQTTWPGWY